MIFAWWAAIICAVLVVVAVLVREWATAIEAGIVGTIAVAFIIWPRWADPFWDLVVGR